MLCQDDCSQFLIESRIRYFNSKGMSIHLTTMTREVLDSSSPLLKYELHQANLEKLSSDPEMWGTSLRTHITAKHSWGPSMYSSPPLKSNLETRLTLQKSIISTWTNLRGVRGCVGYGTIVPEDPSYRSGNLSVIHGYSELCCKSQRASSTFIRRGS